MLVLDANLWIAAFHPADVFHEDSVELFRVAAERGPVEAPAALRTARPGSPLLRPPRKC